MNLSSHVNIILIYMTFFLQNAFTQSENTLGNDENLPTCNYTFTDTTTKVDCSGLGLSQLPTGIPGNTTHLYLTNNEFTSFDMNTFLQFTSLRQIFISRNKLTRTPTFPPTVTLIDLSDNEITHFGKDTFLQYHRLKTIYLTRNNLTRILPMFPENIEKIIVDSNPLEVIEPYTFFKLKRVRRIHFTDSKSLVELKENSLAISSGTRPGTVIVISGKSFSKIESGAFKNISDGSELHIYDTNITRIPARMIQGTRWLYAIEISFSKVQHIDPEAFIDQELIFKLYLHNNMLTKFPVEAFSNLFVSNILDLSANKISWLGDGPILNKSPLQLYLASNEIQNISRDNFSGLKNLTEIIVLQNKITHIADRAFKDTKLAGLLLQSNLLTRITDEVFYIKSKKLDYLYIFDNPLEEIEDNALSNNMAVNSTAYLKCESLETLPAIHNEKNINIYCVKSTTDIVFDKELLQTEAGKGRLYGMICDNNQCRPCKQGYYGYVGRDLQNMCYACPPGGFYQDITGYATLGDYTANCKTCPVGSFSPNSGGQSVADCQTCPRGTKTDRIATLNACECLDNFHRTDRYGPCQPCPEGVDCTNGVQRLIQGYWWSWDAMGDAGSFKEYEKFISDMKDSKVDRNNPDELNTTKYTGQLPAVHICLRSGSCLGGEIDGSCSDGYAGWLCGACDLSYYELFNECYPCQKVAVIFTVFVVIIIALGVIGYIVWKLDKRGNRGASITSFFTHIKITINFYQILGILSEVNEIHWPDDFQSVGQSLQYLDIIRYVNILSPKCIFPGTWNAYTLLYIAIATPFAIVILTFIIFCLKKLFYRYRSDQSVHNIKENFFSVTIMMLYLTYANTCSNIMAVGPWSIRKFNATENGSIVVSILTSDYSIDVEQGDGAVYNIHKKIVYYSLIYIVCFPLMVIIVLYLKYKRNNVQSSEILSGQSENFGLMFFFKQYTNKFWYWEVFEMYNKALLSLIANFKDDQASNMSYSLFITVVLIALHLYLEPMKNKSDQRFKLLTLCFIVVNLSVGAIVDLDATLYTPDNTITFLHDFTPFILLFINFSILFLLIVDFIKKIRDDIWNSLQQPSQLNNTDELESDSNDDSTSLRYHNAASYEDKELLDISINVK